MTPRKIGKLNLQYKPRDLQHLHTCKLHTIWRIYMQNICLSNFTRAITHSLNYTQDVCIYRRKFSSLTFTCKPQVLILLMADLKKEISIFYIIFNFSKNLHVGMEIILNHVFYNQNSSCNL